MRYIDTVWLSALPVALALTVPASAQAQVQGEATIASIDRWQRLMASSRLLSGG